MPIQALPETEDIRELMHGLLGRDVTVSRVAPEKVDPTAKIVVGLYEREDAKVGAVVAADLSIAAYAGAALALIPVGMANEGIGDGVLEDMLAENFQEVLNVGVRWFTAKGNPRLRLAEMYVPGGTRPPDDVAVVMATPAERLDVECEVAGYGKGRMRLMVTDF